MLFPADRITSRAGWAAGSQGELSSVSAALRGLTSGTVSSHLGDGKPVPALLGLLKGHLALSRDAA